MSGAGPSFNLSINSDLSNDIDIDINVNVRSGHIPSSICGSRPQLIIGTNTGSRLIGNSSLITENIKGTGFGSALIIGSNTDSRVIDNHNGTNKIVNLTSSGSGQIKGSNTGSGLIDDSNSGSGIVPSNVSDSGLITGPIINSGKIDESISESKLVNNSGDNTSLGPKNISKAGINFSKNTTKGYTYLRINESCKCENGKRNNRKFRYIGKVDPATGQNIYYPKYIEEVKGTDREPADMCNQLIYSKNDIAYSETRKFGFQYILSHIASLSGLQRALISVFPTKWPMILDLANFLSSTGEPAMYCKFWQDDIDSLSQKELTSQRISDLLVSISEKDRIEFYCKWAKNIGTRECFALDITSVSSYSELIGDVDWGYNRDDENLPQINLCLLTGEKSKTPIFPMLYDGAIKDVSILPSMIASASKIKFGRLSYVMDKGLYSTENVNFMLNTSDKIQFLTATPFTTNFAKAQVKLVKNMVRTPERAIHLGASSIQGLTHSIKWDKSHNVFSHIFF
jgi:hypothetical protein